LSLEELPGVTDSDAGSGRFYQSLETQQPVTQVALVPGQLFVS
jgi:hypothetical protein